MRKLFNGSTAIDLDEPLVNMIKNKFTVEENGGSVASNLVFEVIETVEDSEEEIATE